MFGILLSTFLLSSTAAYFNESSHHWNLFQNFIKKHDKRYESLNELTERFEIFLENLHFVEKVNSNNNQYKLGITKFSDLTSQEFSHFFNERLTLPFGSPCNSFVSSTSNLPDEIDWRSKNAVTDVKDQGQCGSCWSFSTTGAVEGAWAVSKGKLVSLSEQELVDCAGGRPYGNHGCNGGLMDGAFQYIIDNNGICSEDEYPYVSGETKSSGDCNKDCSPVATLSSCVDVTPNNQLHLKESVSMNPVSVAIQADSRVFQLYKEGVITSDACGTQLDHGVLVVGYGSEDNVDYWLVKNSWSESWGDHGYVKIERSDSTNDPGICGIAMQPSYPVV